MSRDKSIHDKIQEELAPFMKISDEIIASRQQRRERLKQESQQKVMNRIQNKEKQ